MKTYTVKRVRAKQITKSVSRFIYEAGLRLNAQDGGRYFWEGFPLKRFAEEQYLIVCFRNKLPVGFLAASFYRSIFDPSVTMLYQNVLFSLPNTRSSFLLLKEFIDFGKSNTKHTISCIGQNTRIKPESLERLGFTKLEELYRMEN